MENHNGENLCKNKTIINNNKKKNISKQINRHKPHCALLWYNQRRERPENRKMHRSINTQASASIFIFSQHTGKQAFSEKHMLLHIEREGKCLATWLKLKKTITDHKKTL